MKILIWGETFTYPLGNRDVVVITNNAGETVEVNCHALLEFARYINLWRQITAEDQELKQIGTVLQE